MGILLWIQENLKNEYLDSFFKLITFLTDKGLIWVIIGLVLLAYKPTRKLALIYILALAFNFMIVNIFLKPMVQRIRPFDIMTVELIIKSPRDFSFPSGHSSAAFSASTVIFLINKKWGCFFLLASVIIAFSRLYLFVHYPSDVFIGVLLGVLSAILANICYKKIIKKH